MNRFFSDFKFSWYSEFYNPDKIHGFRYSVFLNDIPIIVLCVQVRSLYLICFTQRDQVYYQFAQNHFQRRFNNVCPSFPSVHISLLSKYSSQIWSDFNKNLHVVRRDIFHPISPKLNTKACLNFDQNRSRFKYIWYISILNLVQLDRKKLHSIMKIKLN